MARINRRPATISTHEGGKAQHINAELELRRTVLSCMLWEKNFYESGQLVADRIKELIPKVKPEVVANLAVEARMDMKLRHVPLLITRIMARLPTHKAYVSEMLYQVINRPDELNEFLAMYWSEGKCSISNQVKLGLAKAFTKFNEYQLAKWSRPSTISLRDVMFMVHPKPKNKEQAKMWERFVNNDLTTPDTWEVAISAPGANKKFEWSRLLKDNKLGGMALLRNLRNMDQANVDEDLVRQSLLNMKSSMILPYRYIAAAKYAPGMEDVLEQAMLSSLKTHNKLPGKTVLLLDVSGSMGDKLSAKSDLTRLDAACGLAMLLREICEQVDVYTFSLKLVRVPARRGFALRDAIINSQDHNATYLNHAIKNIYANKGTKDRFPGNWSGHITMHGQGLNPDRLIVISDEQAHDEPIVPKSSAYMLNVAANNKGVSYGSGWTGHIDGFSESCVKWIQELETNCSM